MTGTRALFATAIPTRDLEGLVTKFVRFEYLRAHGDLHEDEAFEDFGARIKVLFWYLSDHIRERRQGRLVPLSERQIAFLNSPAPIAGLSPAVTIALYNFVLRERPACAVLTDRSALVDAVYWWCIEKTPSMRLESLVTDAQIALLTSQSSGIDEPFATNAFTARFIERHHDLRDLDMGSGRDRVAALHYLILYAFVNPHIRKFLPQQALRNSLTKQGNADCLLDLVIARYCFSGARKGDLVAARDLRRMGVETLEREAMRLDMASESKPAVGDIGECLIGLATSAPFVEEGVALIGPVRRSSGLGQAIRLSFDILIQAECIPPTVYEFDLDDPSLANSHSLSKFPSYTKRRAINLVHLNAESFPLLYAYAPSAVVSESYNIGYFFWELNKIPPSHELALEQVDEIWVASEYGRETYARYTDKPVVNVGMAVAALENVVATPRAELGLADDSFVFMTSFDSFSFLERKNPLGVIEAFRVAFPKRTEKTQLILKTQNRFFVNDPYQARLWTLIDAAVAADPRIKLINETYTYEKLLSLKRACDCYVSFHRSEGWGFGIIEAMQLGLPVIVTGYSGNMEFCNPDTAFLVDYELVGVREAEYQAVPRGSHWAAPSIASGVEHMKRVMNDKTVVALKCAAAATLIRAEYSVTAIATRYAQRLAEIRSFGTVSRIVP